MKTALYLLIRAQVLNTDTSKSRKLLRETNIKKVFGTNTFISNCIYSENYVYLTTKITFTLTITMKPIPIAINSCLTQSVFQKNVQIASVIALDKSTLNKYKMADF